MSPSDEPGSGRLADPSAPPAASADAHAQWLAEWLRSWPGASPSDRAHHFRALAAEIHTRLKGMPDPESRQVLLHIADRYLGLAERNERHQAEGRLEG
jgi:hypothetical protein